MTSRPEVAGLAETVVRLVTGEIVEKNLVELEATVVSGSYHVRVRAQREPTKEGGA